MRADNHGEGGILALMALVTEHGRPRLPAALIVAGLFGAALIYGDGIITPAISVLSALEGVNVVTDVLQALRAAGRAGRPGDAVLRRRCAARPASAASSDRSCCCGSSSSPCSGCSACCAGRRSCWRSTRCTPSASWSAHGWQTFVVLGGVFLALTGGEAMYADMGHLGRKPIRLSWFCVVLPALLLCYAGQTALLLENPGLDGNPFFQLSPGWAVVPLVVLATFATIIASQAIITGAFSLTRQAMQLGWFPGLNIRQTSDQEYGQIYVPVVNWTMMVCTLVLTFSFGSSDALAGAYGTAVSTTMLLTTALLFNAMRDIWRWPVAVGAASGGVFLLIDLAFFGANLLKIREGGWIPLAAGRADLPGDDDLASRHPWRSSSPSCRSRNPTPRSWRCCAAARSRACRARRCSSAAATAPSRRCWCAMSSRSRRCRKPW